MWVREDMFLHLQLCSNGYSAYFVPETEGEAIFFALVAA